MKNNLYEKLIDICVKINDVDSIHYFIDIICCEYQKEINQRDQIIDDLYITIDKLQELL